MTFFLVFTKIFTIYFAIVTFTEKHSSLKKKTNDFSLRLQLINVHTHFECFDFSRSESQ